jgi:divalent metal cation (Fe/Co/Zn/Cd) transporter
MSVHPAKTQPPRLLALAPAAPEASGDPDCCDACTATPVDPGWVTAARHARLLSWASLIWMTGEGVLGLIAGLQAGSISLLGWALGSVIEGLASVIVIWRFTGNRTLSETAEGRAQKAVAVSFFLLAPYIAIEAVRDLAGAHLAQNSGLGIGVTAASLLVMPGLGIAKQRLGTRLRSGATAGEGVQNLLCAAQAAAVLIGLAATAAFGLSWADPAIALLLAAWAIREGIAAWRGEDCC